jgi:hypothetical protein
VIPSAYVQEWSGTTPWPDSRQAEQDLIICRAVCDIFNDPDRNLLIPRLTRFVEFYPGSA